MSRDKILQTVRQNVPEFKPLPVNWKNMEQKSTQKLKDIFKERLIQVGAKFIELNPKEDIASIIAEHFPGASDFSKSEIWEEYSADCPKDKLNQLGNVLLEGQLGVAENGAIWLDDSDFPNRLIPFIAQQVIIKLDSRKIVADMSEAYCRINLAKTGFGVFISGPSKTADIEQSLVYGAHGPKALTVIISSAI
jgi:L-lactate dehydrogenase complex protein LldG